MEQITFILKADILSTSKSSTETKIEHVAHIEFDSDKTHQRAYLMDLIKYFTVLRRRSRILSFG